MTRQRTRKVVWLSRSSSDAKEFAQSRTDAKEFHRQHTGVILPSYESNAKGFIEHIEHCIKQSLNYKGMTIEDRAWLKDAQQRLRPSFDELAKWYVEPQRALHSEHAEYGYERLWQLMTAAFIAGSNGIITESARKLFQAQSQSKRGKKSGEARLANRAWVQHAEELMIQICEEPISQDDLATEVRWRWKLEDSKPPSCKTLIKHIRTMERGGRLTRQRTGSLG